MLEIEITQKQAKDLQNCVQTHVELCMEEANGELEIEDDIWDGPFYPFCGCPTCETREYLMATFTWLRKNGILDLYIED